MFNKETQYAIRALVYIQARNNESHRPGIQEIALETDAPQYFIAKILQRLVRQGLLKSAKGRGGGFYFDNEKDDITIKELVSLIEGDRKLNGCGFGLRQCNPENPCPLHKEYSVIRNAINLMVTSETIQSLAIKTELKSS
jgi:Rrf2 family protein